jgi:multiple sugar transport system substrate-binding protein
MTRKLWSIISLLAILAMIVSGCGGTTATPAATSVPPTQAAQATGTTATQPTGTTAATAATTGAATATSGTGAAPTGQTINVLVEGGGHSLQQPIADLWQKQTGNKVNFIEVPYQQVYDKLSAEMAAGGSSYDVATLDVIWLSHFSQFAEPLDSMFTADVKQDLFPSLVQDAQSNGHFIGMPQWANAEVLYYRKDLFSDPKEQANFKAKYGYDLNPPTTWQQFTDMAQFFTRKDASGNVTLYGTDAKGAVETEWLAEVLQAGSPGVVLDKSGNVIINNAQHVQALQFDADLACKYKVTPPNAAEIDWNAAQNLFYQGQTAMMLFWAHAYRMTPADSKVADKVGVAPMIGGPGGVGAIPGPWYNFVPSAGKNKDLAKQYVQFAYDHNDLGIQAPLGLAARISAYQGYASKPGYEHFNALISTLNAPQTMGRPLVNNWQEITDQVLIPTVQQALSCKATPQEILNNAATQIKGMKP